MITSQDKLDIKLKIIKEFERYRFSLVEIFAIFDELKGEISDIVVKKELKRLKFRR